MKMLGTVGGAVIGGLPGAIFGRKRAKEALERSAPTPTRAGMGAAPVAAAATYGAMGGQ